MIEATIYNLRKWYFTFIFQCNHKRNKSQGFTVSKLQKQGQFYISIAEITSSYNLSTTTEKYRYFVRGKNLIINYFVKSVYILYNVLLNITFSIHSL